MKSRKKNKKANIPIILFVIGVFLVCSFALLTFFISDFKFTNTFVGLDLMGLLNKDIDEYNFYVNQGVLSFKAAKYLGASVDEDGRRYLSYEKEYSSLSSFLGAGNSEKELLFSVTYYLPQG